MSPTTGPEYTNRFNLFRAAEVTGAPAAGYSSDQALDALERVAASVLPNDMSYAWNALSYQERSAAGTGGIVFVMALVFVFLILAAQYESWSLPLGVLLGTPIAVFGAMLGLWLSGLFLPGYQNNVFAQIGLVMLIGMAAKNAILIVEFAKMKSDEGLDALSAALAAARERFRPILMTAFSFILGVIPLLIATGAGAEARKVMGMTVFSGMLAATVLGVILVPALYVFIERVSGRDKKDAQALT
jgi:HAE1 family hydrophobic/amphiphilic exporter-1